MRWRCRRSSTQVEPPDTIVLATSSGGTQAGLIAGSVLLGLPTRIIGISADDPAAVIAGEIRRILTDLEVLLGTTIGVLSDAPIEIDDTFVGDGYGVPTPDSTRAIEVCARTEALFLDPTYTAKAMAGLMARVRDGKIERRDGPVLAYRWPGWSLRVIGLRG